MDSLDELWADLIGKDEGRAEAAAVNLARMGETILPRLRTLFDSGDADQRWWAVRVLGEMTDPPKRWLIDALDDLSPDVRGAAALALTLHPMESTTPALVSALKDDDGVVATLAVRALVAIGKPAVPDLLDEFQLAPQRARIQILRSLAEIGDPRAIPLMLKASEEESALLQYWANEGLERLGLNMVYINPE